MTEVSADFIGAYALSTTLQFRKTSDVDTSSLIPYGKVGLGVYGYYDDVNKITYLLADEKISLKTFLDNVTNTECNWLKPHHMVKNGYRYEERYEVKYLYFYNSTMDYGEETETTFRLHSDNFQGVYFDNFDGSKVKNISIRCPNITTIDVRSFNGPLDDFSFKGCTNLKEIDTRGWNISNMTRLENNFLECKYLETIKGIEFWDTSNIQHLDGTFNYCEHLQFLPIHNWDVRNVITLDFTFAYCTRLRSVPIYNWNMPKLYSLGSTFDNCRQLEALSFENWGTPEDCKFYATFRHCSVVQRLYAGYDAFHGPYMFREDVVFRGCNGLEWGNHPTMDPILGKYFTDVAEAVSRANPYYIQRIIKGIYAIEGDDYNRHQGYDVTEEVYFISFYELPATAEYQTTMFDLGSGRLPVYIFAEMSDTPIIIGDKSYTFPKKLYFVGEGKIDLSSLYDKFRRFLAFDDTTPLFNPKKVYFNNVMTSNMTSMKNMFRNWDRLTELDLSKFVTSQVTEMSEMFNNCSSLETIYISDKWDVGNVTSSVGMFSGCTKLKGDIEYSDSNSNDKTFATPTSGYMTYKPSG